MSFFSNIFRKSNDHQSLLEYGTFTQRKDPLDLSTPEKRRKCAEGIVDEFFKNVKNSTMNFDEFFSEKINSHFNPQERKKNSSQISNLKRLSADLKKTQIKESRERIIGRCVYELKNKIKTEFATTKLAHGEREKDIRKNQAAILTCYHLAGLINKDIYKDLVFYYFTYCDDFFEVTEDRHKFIDMVQKEFSSKIEEIKKWGSDLNKDPEYIGKQHLFSDVEKNIVKELEKTFKQYLIGEPKHGIRA